MYSFFFFYCCHNHVVEKNKLIWSLKLYLKALKGSHSKHLPCWHPSKWKPFMDIVWWYRATVCWFEARLATFLHAGHPCVPPIIWMCLHLMITHISLPFFAFLWRWDVFKGLIPRRLISKRGKSHQGSLVYDSILFQSDFFWSALPSTDMSWTFLKFQSKGRTWSKKPLKAQRLCMSVCIILAYVCLWKVAHCFLKK